MALIKFGSVVTDGSGKLGGHVFQNSKGGMQLRTKPIPSGKPSLSQISIRSINKTLQKGWHDLTDAQRKVWNDWAVSHSIMTVRDPRKPISGHDLWMKYQYQRLVESLPFLSDPSLHLPTYLGPEIFPVLNFFTWTNRGGSIVDSNLSFHSTAVGGFQKAAFADPGYYRLIANIFSLTGNYSYVDETPVRYQLFNLTRGYSVHDFQRKNVVASNLYIRNNVAAPAQVTFISLSLRKIYNY